MCIYIYIYKFMLFMCFNLSCYVVHVVHVVAKTALRHWHRGDGAGWMRRNESRSVSEVFQEAFGEFWGEYFPEPFWYIYIYIYENTQITQNIINVLKISIKRWSFQSVFIYFLKNMIFSECFEKKRRIFELLVCFVFKL